MKLQLDEWADFVRCSLDAALYAVRIPALWLPSILFSLATDMTVYAIHWPAPGEAPAPERSITIMVLTILARGWFSLTFCKIALAILRHQDAGLLRQWLSVQTAIRIGVVSFVLLFPILLGLIVFVVPGIYLMARWSQVAMLLIDGEAGGFDAVTLSGALTAGYRPPLVVFLIIVSAITLLIEYCVGNAQLLLWIYHALAGTFGAALAAGTYYELNRRAPWNA